MKNRKCLVIISIILTIICVGIIAGILFINNKPKNNNDKKENKENKETKIVYDKTEVDVYLLKNGEDTYTLVFTNAKDKVKKENVDSDIWVVNKDTVYGYYNQAEDKYIIDYPAWIQKTEDKKITKVEIKKEINPTNMSFWFKGLKDVTEIKGLDKINTENVKSITGIFMGCSSLKELDLSSWNIKNVVDISDMFRGCTNLTTIYVGKNWNIENVKSSSEMFLNAQQLVGGKGTKYNADKVDGEYARVDTADNKGYFTSK